MRRGPVLVALIAVLAAALSGVVGWGAAALIPGKQAVRTSAGPTYPFHVDDTSMWVADVGRSPTGRAMVLVDGNVAFGASHRVFAADSNRARAVAAFDGRGSGADDPIPARLSPDGRLLAIGDESATAGDILLVDLATGTSHRYPADLPSGGTVEVLAWSADSTRLAFTAGDLGVLDVTSGAFTTFQTSDPQDTSASDLLPGETPLSSSSDAPVPDDPVMPGVQAAFSPDGKTLAYDDGFTIDLYRADGTGGPVLLTDKQVWLAGPAAWTPDGKQVLVTRDQPDGEKTALLAVDVATKRAKGVATFDFLDFSAPTPVGWQDGQVLLSGFDADDALVVDAYGLDGRRQGRIVNYGYSTTSVDFATGLLAGATARTGPHESGPTPTGVRLVVGVVAGLLTALLLGVVSAAIGVPILLRRRTARRRTAPGPVPAWPAPGWPAPGGPAPGWPMGSWPGPDRSMEVPTQRLAVLQLPPAHGSSSDPEPAGAGPNVRAEASSGWGIPR